LRRGRAHPVASVPRARDPDENRREGQAAADAGRLLDACDFVTFYARNDHLGLAIPYEFMGVSHDYEPDFLVRLANNLTLLLEIKGYEVHNAEQTNSKHNAARRWVRAVNNLGEFGRWDFLVCRDLDKLRPSLAASARVNDSQPT
jgi:type III restriction enzyme